MRDGGNQGVTRPGAGTFLCRIDEIADPGAKGFVFGDGDTRWEVFAVRKGDAIHAYENACPHAGTPLDMFPDRFLTRDRARILCSTHGAQFRIEDGHCVSGPCVGDRLRAVGVSIDSDGRVRLGGG